MAIARPTLAQPQDLASRLHVKLSPHQASEYLALMQGGFDACDLIDGWSDEVPPVRHARATGRRTAAAENRHNAWYCKTGVQGTTTRAATTPRPRTSARRARAFEMIGNTAPQDITGHPAMSIPCGNACGLPFGVMPVGRRWAESTVYQV